jgi:hypothetical protein
MKRYLSIIAAGCLALLAASCVKEERAVVDFSNATPPAMVSVTVDDNVTVQYTPAAFPRSFNEKMATYHTLALVSIAGKETNYTLSTKNDGSTLTLTGRALTNVLKARGYVTGDQIPVEIVVRGSLQDPSRGITNGYVDSKEKYSFTWTMPDDSVAGNPWEEYTETSSWGLIGSIASTGNSWNADGPMYSTPDGTRHVARNVKFATTDQFKVRKDGGWDVNFGAPGDTEPYVMTIGEAIEATPGGKNLGVPVDGNYDLLLDEDAGTLTLFAAYVTYPGFDEVSTWSVIGNIASVPMEWNKDIQMTTDGQWHVAEGVVLTTADQFKFRKDCAWTDNFGAPGDTEPFVMQLDEEYDAAAGGKNLAVPADGTYDLLVNPDAALIKVVASLGGKSPLVGGDTPPEPPAPAVTGWNIIGLNGDWDNDVRATEDNGVWTAYITATPAEGEETTEFKWRKDGDWAENYGGVFVTLGEPFEAVADGANIKIGAGFWKVVLNTNDKTITISNGQVWSLIGVNGDWSTDIDMALAEGKWVSPVTKIKGEFKIRENHAWNNDRGGTFVAVGEPFEAVAGGGNINVPEGNYVVTYDPTAETIVVDETGWGVVGTINSWGESPDIILKEEGLFLVARNITLSDTDEIKIRYKSDWAVNRGGATNVGHAVKAIQDAGNIKPGVAGDYDVWYRPDSEVLFVMPAGSELTYWGVVGTINGWAAPDHIMYENEAGQFVFEDLELTASDKIKIRQNEDWAVNRGGTFGNLGEAFEVTQDGSDIAVGRDAKVTVTYDPAAETLTFTGEYQGDAPAKPAVWSLIGTLNDTGWGTDFDLTNTSGDTWVIKNVAVTATDEFKIRADHDWATSVGGPEGNDVSVIDAGNPYEVFKPELGVAFAAGDKNIHIGVEGAYTITFDYAAKTILIEAYQEFPEHLYMIGDEFGGWDWNSEGVVEMTPVLYNADWANKAPGQFWTVRFFHAGKGFKYCAKRAWDGDFWGLETNDGFTEVGGNCTVAEDGVYMVHIDLKNGKVHVEPARIYGIGDAFGGWDEGMENALFTAADGKLTGTTSADGELRMYATSSIANSDWWTREFIILDGKIVCRGNGGDQERVSVKAGQKVTLDFNAGTGTIE